MHVCFQTWTGALSSILQTWRWRKEKMLQSLASHHTADRQLRCHGSKTTSFLFPQIMWLYFPVEISFSKGVCVCPLKGSIIVIAHIFGKSLKKIPDKKSKYIRVFKCVCVCVCPRSIFCSIQEHDSGSYFCRASNPHLQRFLTSQRATLTVQGRIYHSVQPNPKSTIIIISSSWQLRH